MELRVPSAADVSQWLEQEEIGMAEALDGETQESMWRYLRSCSNFHQAVDKSQAREK